MTRLAININALPTALDLNGFERSIMHWSPKPWRNGASAEFVRSAFTLHETPGAPRIEPSQALEALCLDIEPPATWYERGESFQQALNVQTNARQRVASVYPEHPIWAFDPCGGTDPLNAVANVCACRQLLDGLDAAGHSGYYPDADGLFPLLHSERAAYLTTAFKMASERCYPGFATIGFTTIRARGEGKLVEPSVFERACESAVKHGVDILYLWQAEPYWLGWPGPQKIIDTLQPYIDIARKYGNA